LSSYVAAGISAAMLFSLITSGVTPYRARSRKIRFDANGWTQPTPVTITSYGIPAAIEVDSFSFRFVYVAKSGSTFIFG
jgi:hypothetical protein